MIFTQEAKDYIDKINQVTGFHAKWNKKRKFVEVEFKNQKLYPMLDGMPAILSRQLGYDLAISEMFKTGMEFHSAEEKYYSKKHQEQYHKNFYCFTEAISPSRVKVIIKYFDSPENANVNDLPRYLSTIKNKVKSNFNFQIVYTPFGSESMEMKLDIGGFRIRPNMGNSFYFLVELDANTYGDVMLKVDQIIRDLES